MHRNKERPDASSHPGELTQCLILQPELQWSDTQGITDNENTVAYWPGKLRIHNALNRNKSGDRRRN